MIPDGVTITVFDDAMPVATGPWPAPAGTRLDLYRSIGVEPMLGRAFDLANAESHEQVRVPASGELSWRLTVRASRT